MIVSRNFHIRPGRCWSAAFTGRYGCASNLIVLVKVSLLLFFFIFKIQQSVQVILNVSFVSSEMESKREWITHGFKKWGLPVFFPHSFVEFYQRAQQNLFFACLTED